MIKRGEFLDEDGNTLTSNAESPAGYRMEMAVLKTKFCKWDRKIGSTVFSYTDGVDILQDTIDVAIKLGLIDNSTQGVFKLIDLNTGEVITNKDGSEVKIRGKKNVKPYLKEHMEIWKQLYDKIYEKISLTNDPNITAFEEMMKLGNVDFGFDINGKNIEEM